MNKIAIQLLIQWVHLVTLLMCSNWVSYSNVERGELARASDELIKELNK